MSKEKKTIDKIVSNPASFNIALGLIVSGGAVAATWEIYHMMRKHALATSLSELKESGIADLLLEKDILKFFSEDKERKNRLETSQKLVDSAIAKDGHIQLADLAEKTCKYKAFDLRVKDLLKEIELEGGVPELGDMKPARQRLALTHLSSGVNLFFEQLENYMRIHLQKQRYQTSLESVLTNSEWQYSNSFSRSYSEIPPDKILQVRKFGKNGQELLGFAPLFLNPATRKKVEVGTFRTTKEAISDTVLSGFFRIADYAYEHQANLVVFNPAKNQPFVNEAISSIIFMFGRERRIEAEDRTKQVVLLNKRSFFHHPPKV